MKRSIWQRIDLGSAIGIPAAVVIFVLAQTLEGGSVQSLWQPTAALVVFGGTSAAVLVSYPFDVVLRTVVTTGRAFVTDQEPVEAMLTRFVDFAQRARRHGLMALEADVERTPEPFLRAALALAVDGTHPSTARQILEIESRTRREAAELPAEVLETAAGYSPTLGILGAVLGLIHVMESLTEPTKLGAGIAVAFVATVYGVGAANLVLLPLATRLRSRARHGEQYRELIVEGIAAIQEGLNPRLMEQKLRGFLTTPSPPRERRRAA